MSDTWNAEMQAYDDCELCSGGMSAKYPFCPTCLKRRIAEVEGQRDTLAAALSPFALALREIPEGVRSTLRYWNGALDGQDISLSISTDDLIAAADALAALETAQNEPRDSGA